MTTWRALIGLLCLVVAITGPLASSAGPAQITSGEHPGFTRLVVQFDHPLDWQLGRTLDGYALRTQQDRPAYDLAKAFDLIGKSRLAAIWADPKTGDLHFGIACTCYVIPFEFRPGIVVVDLRDGAPPKGSSFEQPLDSPVPAIGPPEQAKPPAPAVVAATSYDWTDLALKRGGTEPGGATTANPTATYFQSPVAVDPALEPLRLSLIEEMGRGASQGIVDMAKPKKTPEPHVAEGDPSVQIHLGETPDLMIHQKGVGRAPLTAQGALCITDDQVDVPSWGSSRRISDQIGPEREGLTVEFDRPDPDAVTRATRFQLFMGFGAEARSLTRAFQADLPDKAIWDSMAHILDDEPDPAPAFAGMQDCDTAAALWSVLGDPVSLPADDVGKAAILRSFSALPAHLRRQLGPRLVNHFLAAGDIPVATGLRDAVVRAPGDPGPEIVVMQAAMERALGRPVQSEGHLEPMAAKPGPSSTEALLALVEQKANLGQTVGYDQVLALEEALKERQGGADAPRYQHALVLARAASGDFDGAFAEASQSPEAWPTVWKLLAQAGPDSALLTHAALAPGQAPPTGAKAATALIADRLLGLGLADQAAAWLAQAEHPPNLLAARIDLAQGQAQAALSRLESDDSPMALGVKAAALQALNDEKGAADLYAQLGKPEEQWAAVGRSQAWDVLAREGPAPWKAVAEMVAPASDSSQTSVAPNGPDGMLTRNKALVAQSAATRDAVAALLDSVKSPAPPSQ
jgi:hypothetical protein